MTLAQFSFTAMVLAAVAYLLAMVLHAMEWASARGLASERSSDGSEDAQRIRVETFGRLGVAATAVSAVIHIAAVVTRGVAAHRMPWGNMYEFVTSAMAFLVVIYLLVLWRTGARWLGLGVNLLASVGLGLAVTVFYVDVSPLLPALHSVWFVIHIIAAAISAAGFNVGAVAAVVFLIRQAREKKADGELTGYWARIPSTKGLDVFSYRMHAFAFPLWTFTLLAGAIWAQYAWGRAWNWDPKEVWSFVTFLIYAAYLHARATAGWRGTRAAWIALLGVASFWFNFVGVNLLFQGMHAYSGI